MARSKLSHDIRKCCCFPLTSSLNVLVLQVEVFNILFVTDNKKHSVYCQDCARKTSANLSGFIVLNQVRIDCTFFLPTGRMSSWSGMLDFYNEKSKLKIRPIFFTAKSLEFFKKCKGLYFIMAQHTKTTVIVLFWWVGEKLGWTISNICNAFLE